MFLFCSLSQFLPLFSPTFCLCLSAPQLIFLFFCLFVFSESKIYITQIKAQCGEHAFGTFVRPPSSIESIAEEKSGISYDGNQMCFWGGGGHVESVCIKEALTQFLQFLTKFGNQPVVIVGHNIKRYGCYNLLTAALAYDMVDWLRAAIHGFVDICILFQKCTRDPRSPTSETSENTIEDLYKSYISQQEPYNPSQGARVLRDIVAEAGISDETLQQNFFSFVSFECRFSWKPLEKEKVITQYFMGKAVESNLHFDTVWRARNRGNKEAVRDVLTQRMAAWSRMRNQDTVLDKICGYHRD